MSRAAKPVLAESRSHNQGLVHNRRLRLTGARSSADRWGSLVNCAIARA
jgi:hypothetical protein